MEALTVLVLIVPVPVLTELAKMGLSISTPEYALIVIEIAAAPVKEKRYVAGSPEATGLYNKYEDIVVEEGYVLL